MSDGEMDYVSAIGTSYLEPICILLEHLVSFGNKGVNEVQTSPRENGLSSSIIILSVLLLESAINRTQYVKGRTPPKKPLDFISDEWSNELLTNEIIAIFVIRDVIAHNHLWEAKISWDIKGSLQHKDKPRLLDGYGDKKFGLVIDNDSRLTKTLQLNLFPSRINYQDVVKVLKTVTKLLLMIEDEDRRYFYLSHQNVKWQDETILFTEVINNLN